MGVKEAFISTRPWSFPMTGVIVSFGAAYALFRDGVFNPWTYLATLVGVVLLHASVNLLNDYFDYRRGIDNPDAPTVKYRPHPILAGFYAPSVILVMGGIYAAAGFALGIYLAYLTDITTLYLGLLGLLLVYMYNGPPLALKYRALGEIEVFLVWGVLMPLGAYYVQVQRLDLTVSLAAAPMGLFVVAVLLANNLRDVDFDRASGIKTLPVIMGLDRGLKVYQALMYAPYVLQAAMIILRTVPLLTLATLVTIVDVKRVLEVFRRRVPEAADPMTAGILLKYGSIYLATLLIAALLHLP